MCVIYQFKQQNFIFFSLLNAGGKHIDQTRSRDVTVSPHLNTVLFRTSRRPWE